MFATLLSQTSFQIPITPFFLVVIFSILAASALIHAVILRYHWKNYGTSALETVRMSLIYFVGLSILLAGMVVFILVYATTSL